MTDDSLAPAGNVLEQMLKSVVFVGFHNKKWDQIATIGTAFVLGIGELGANDRKVRNLRLVTARHVISGLAERGAEEVYLRFNASNGGSFWRKTLLEDWDLSNNAALDVAAYGASLPGGVDHLAIPIQADSSNTPPPFSVELADEVYVAGLFSPYKDRHRLTPLLRVANLISIAQSDRPVSTPVGDFSAHLLEMKSIAGMSGAPVIAKAGLAHLLSGRAKAGVSSVYLLGLVSGHFVEKGIEVPLSTDENPGFKVDINAGVAFVTPVEAISRFINSIERKDSRQRLFFPSNSNSSEGSLMRAIRYLPPSDLATLVEHLPEMATLKFIEDTDDDPPKINAVAFAKLLLLGGVIAKLREAGWDGTFA